MTTEDRVENNLPALEYLLERADSYCAVSARVALVGGLLSVALSGAMLLLQMGDRGRNIDARVFFQLWSLVFVATLTAGTYFLWRDAERRGEPLISAGLKLAVSSILPSLFAGAAIGACVTLTSGLPIFPAIFWVVFYGLGLLSLRHFAPTGLIVLGWTFLLTGVGGFIYGMNETMMPKFDLPTPTNLYPAAIMGVTFGIYHLIYAACVWPRRERTKGMT